MRASIGRVGRAHSARTRGIGLALCVSALFGCVDPFLGPEPSDDPVTLFDLFWAEIDAYYASFSFKPELDWNAVRESYRPQVSPDMTERTLADVLGAVITELGDGHADLRTPFGEYGFNPETGHPVNYDPGVVQQSYLTGRRLFAGYVYEAGWLSDRIAYVRIATMGEDGTGPIVDDVLAYLDGAEALIVDVRSNRGGTDLVSDPIAARFYDQRRSFSRVQYRNGPEHDDLTEPRIDALAPAGRRFIGPVAVLTNRATFSAAENFVTAMIVLPNVVTVGDTTGGGAGNPVRRELPNAWTYRIPRAVESTIDGFYYEGVGLPPDIPVADTDSALEQGRDPILERAIDQVRTRLADLDVRRQVR